MTDIYLVTYLCLSYTIFINLHSHDLQKRNKLIVQLGAYYKYPFDLYNKATLLRLLRCTVLVSLIPSMVIIWHM